MAQQELKISATFEYSGLPDYWGGNGARWADDHACVFAFYGPQTTLRELISEWASDDADQDGKAFFEHFTDAEIETALLEMLTDQGRAELDQICEFARDYGNANGHDYDFAGDDDDRECECCASDDMTDSPQAIVMLAITCDTCAEDASECECEPAPEPVNADDDHALGAPVSGPHSHSGPHGRYMHMHPTDAIAHGAALLPEPSAPAPPAVNAQGEIIPDGRLPRTGANWREVVAQAPPRAPHAPEPEPADDDAAEDEN